MKRLLPKQKGFTLIELMIVVAIIAILSIIGLVIYSGIQKNARNVRRKADVESISRAWEANIAKATPYYPILTGSMFASGSIPRDPKDNTTVYTYTGANETAGADTYKVCATLETTPATTFCLSNQQ